MASKSHLLAAVKKELQPKADETKHKAFEKILKDDLKITRAHLLNMYIDVRQKQIKREHDDYDEAKIMREAKKSALKEFFETYVEWFGLTENQFGNGFEASKNGQGVWNRN